MWRARAESAASLSPGRRLVFADGTPDILAYPRDRAGWGRLSRLLTLGNRRAEKGDCILHLDDLLAHADGLELIVMGRKCSAALTLSAPPRPAASGSPPPCSIAASDRARLARLAELARAAGVPLVAVNDVLYHHPDRRPLQDVLTCIREHLTIDGRPPARRQCRAPSEAAGGDGAAVPRRIRRRSPDAEIADALTLLARRAALRISRRDRSTASRTRRRRSCISPTRAPPSAIPHGVPDKVRASIEHELALIAQLDYAPYFLTVLRHRPLRPQRRASSARAAARPPTPPSATASASPRSIPTAPTCCSSASSRAERREPPDIDVDFEHERREEVIQYIYGKYGRERAGIAATVISYRGRSAVREVGKAIGLSEDAIGALATSIWGGGGDVTEADARARPGSIATATGAAADLRRWRARSSAFRAICPSMSAASSSRAAGSTSWCRSRTPPWTTAPSSNGTRTTSTRSAS